MYTINNQDKWVVGQLHGRLTHDCKLSPDGMCRVFDELTEGYLALQDLIKEQDTKEFLEQ